MNNKVAALVLIILCFFSLMIGIANSKKISSEKSKLKPIIDMNSKIAVITLEGVITADKSSPWGDSYSSDKALTYFKQASKDDSVKAIIFRINSPGGAVGASQEIYDEVIKTRKQKPVVVSMADVAASGGYYIASAADRIVALDGTLTGSIGVIFNTIEISSLSDRLGIKSNVIKSGKFKDIGSMHRKMTSGDKELLNSLIVSTYDQFVSAIEKGRIDRNDSYDVPKTTLSKATLLKYADGRVFNGEQAKKLGFTDITGGLAVAENVANKMAKQRFKIKTDLPVVEYNKMSNFNEIFFGNMGSFLGDKTLDSIIPFSMKNHHRPLLIME